MERNVLKDGEAAFQYEEKDGRITLLRWTGSGSVARIPDMIDGKPVTVIDRKAFLSNKRMREAYLPGGLREIGDWAFAYCSSLRLVRMPFRSIRLGKGVFLQCERLERIMLEKAALSEKDRECIGSLLAAAACRLEAPYLLDPAEAGKRQWLEKWDVRLLQILDTPDEEGYSKTLLCGEEDYGSRENDLDYFLSQKRRQKVRLSLLRLLNNMGLTADVRERLAEYLRAHTKGCAHEETWQVVREEYGTEKEYYDLLFAVGALTEQNFDAALGDMEVELAEMKAYLLRAGEERFGSGGFFDSLTL